MRNVRRADVLTAALHRLEPGVWRRGGEGKRAAAERLRRSISVTREGTGNEFSVGILVPDAEAAAEMANAVAASVIDYSSQEQRAGDGKRLAALSEEQERVQSAIEEDRIELEAMKTQAGHAADGGAANAQQTGDLAVDIARLENRGASADTELRDVKLEESAPEPVFPIAAATPPEQAARFGVARNATMFAMGGLLVGILAAVAARKRDPKIYTAADVEEVLGSAPMAQLPDFTEVPDQAAGEFVLRLAAAIEYACRQGKLRSCVFTGTGPGVGVTTVATRVREALEAMGRATVLMDAPGLPFPVSRASSAGSGLPEAQTLLATQKGDEPTAMVQQTAQEIEAQAESLVLTDTAPLAVSAETEYLARIAGFAIVVIESGVTTRGQLEEAAATLQRLDVAAGYVLNRVALDKTDRAFRLPVRAVEEDLHSHKSSSAEGTASDGSEEAESTPADGQSSEQTAALGQIEPIGPEPAEMGTPAFPAPAVPEREDLAAAGLSTPTLPEPDVVVGGQLLLETVSEPEDVAANDLPTPTVSEPEDVVAAAVSTPVVPAPEDVVANALPAPTDPELDEVVGAQSLPETVSEPEDVAANDVPTPAAPEPEEVVADHLPAPDEVAADHLPTPAVPEPDDMIEAHLSPSAIPERNDLAAAPHSLPVVPEWSPFPAAPARIIAGAPSKAKSRKPGYSATDDPSEMPWWLADLFPQSDEPRPVAPPKPAVFHMPQPASTPPQPSPAAPKPRLEPPPAQSWATPAQSWEHVASEFGKARPAPVGADLTTGLKAGTSREKVREAESGETLSGLASRLSGLRSLLLGLGKKDREESKEPAEKDAETVREPDPARNRPGYARLITPDPSPAPPAGSSVGIHSPKQEATAPEFLPPKPWVEATEKDNLQENGSRDIRDRVEKQDGVPIVPSWRGPNEKK